MLLSIITSPTGPQSRNGFSISSTIIIAVSADNSLHITSCLLLSRSLIAIVNYVSGQPRPVSPVPILLESCTLKTGSINWHLTQFLNTLLTSSFLSNGSTFHIRYNVLSTPIECIQCNYSNPTLQLLPPPLLGCPAKSFFTCQ